MTRNGLFSAELEWLRSAFAEAREAGRPRFALISGEAGIGKAPLAAEFAAETCGLQERVGLRARELARLVPEVADQSFEGQQPFASGNRRVKPSKQHQDHPHWQAGEPGSVSGVARASLERATALDAP